MMKLRMGTRSEWRAWFKRGGLWWVSFALAALGVLWWLLLPHTQDAVRRLGLIYEVVGIVVVFVEIRRASGRHKRDPLHIRLQRYWRALPLISRSLNLQSASVSLSVSYSVSGELAARAESTGLTVEQRLTIVEERANALEAKQVSFRNDLAAEKRDRAAAIKEEADKREAADAGLQDKIVEAETGGLDLSLFGVSWLLVGMLMTTGTQELCQWVLGCR